MIVKYLVLTTECAGWYLDQGKPDHCIQFLSPSFASIKGKFKGSIVKPRVMVFGIGRRLNCESRTIGTIMDKGTNSILNPG